MARFYGYSSIGRNKKFRLEDFELIKRDLLNNLLIRQGEMPGRPTVGNVLWNYLYENLDETTLNNIEAELKKSVEKDPRVRVENVQLYIKDVGILAELTVSTQATTQAQMLRILFDTDNSRISYL